jgi:hypothetical protein
MINVIGSHKLFKKAIPVIGCAILASLIIRKELPKDKIIFPGKISKQ